jgi:hypothetical protein
MQLGELQHWEPTHQVDPQYQYYSLLIEPTHQV